MAAKFFIAVACVAVFNVANSQAIQRIVGPAFNLPIAEQIVPQFLPNQVLLPSVPTVAPYISQGPNVFVDLPGYGVDAVYSTPVQVPATTTIIQDSTVANNLANALQLLVVSNLLSNTLPSMGSPDVYLPGYGPVDLVSPALPLGYPLGGLPAGYSYIY